MKEELEKRIEELQYEADTSYSEESVKRNEKRLEILKALYDALYN